MTSTFKRGLDSAR